MLNNYFKPTPVLARKVGDSLLLAGASIATYAATNNCPKLAITAFWVGLAGKLVTNFFKRK